MNLFLLLFRGPFWVQLLLACGLVWAGYEVGQGEIARAAARAALLKSPPPATVPVGEIRDGKTKGPVEVTVRAQVALDHNVRLVRKTNFVKTGESLLYILVDPDAPKDVKVARAAIILGTGELKDFAAFAAEKADGYGPAGIVLEIGGLRSSEAHASHAKSAIAERGLTLGPDFFFIEPFLHGREAGLAAIPAGRAQIGWPLYAAAGVFALVSLLKARRGGGKARPVAAEPVAAATKAAAALEDAAPGSAAAEKPRNAPRRRNLPGLIALALVGAVAAYAAVTGDFRQLILIPLILFWFAVWLGVALLRRGAKAAAGLALRTASAAQVPHRAPAPVVARPAQPGPIVSTRRMGFGRTKAPDPFDRLSEIARQERLREKGPGAAGRVHPAA